MILRAKFVLPMVHPPIEDGAVVVEGDTVLAVGPVKDIQTGYGGEVRDLGEVVLLPGLINTRWSGAAVSSNGFCSWWR
jgi:imidazolonepropionase-like amidohydrolase